LRVARREKEMKTLNGVIIVIKVKPYFNNGMRKIEVLAAGLESSSAGKKVDASP
jgi:hypothetical protein